MAARVRPAGPDGRSLGTEVREGFWGFEGCTGCGFAVQVYSFEPLPSNYRLLENSIRLNPFRDRVTLVKSAAAAKPGESVIFAGERAFLRPLSWSQLRLCGNACYLSLRAFRARFVPNWPSFDL